MRVSHARIATILTLMALGAACPGALARPVRRLTHSPASSTTGRASLPTARRRCSATARSGPAAAAPRRRDTGRSGKHASGMARRPSSSSRATRRRRDRTGSSRRRRPPIRSRSRVWTMGRRVVLPVGACRGRVESAPGSSRLLGGEPVVSVVVPGRRVGPDHHAGCGRAGPAAHARRDRHGETARHAHVVRRDLDGDVGRVARRHDARRRRAAPPCRAAVRRHQQPDLDQAVGDPTTENLGLHQLDALQGRAPDWSPDDQFVMFESSRGCVDGNYAIFIEAALGGEAVQATDCRRNANHGVWSPDGKRFLFSYAFGDPIAGKCAGGGCRGIAIAPVPAQIRALMHRSARAASGSREPLHRSCARGLGHEHDVVEPGGALPALRADVESRSSRKLHKRKGRRPRERVTMPSARPSVDGRVAFVHTSCVMQRGAGEKRDQRAATRSITIPVRVRAEEKRIMAQVARAQGLGLSTWLRSLGLREASRHGN